MKFLCLHGTDTNSTILEMQLNTLTRSLNRESHTFHYLNGPISSPRAYPGLEGFPGPYCRYYDRQQTNLSTLPPSLANPDPSVKTPEEWMRLLHRLDLDHDRSTSARDFVLSHAASSPDGPFDGIIGFSEGAIVAADVLLEQARNPTAHPFKCGIFFCGGAPWDYEGKKSLLADETEERIRVPTFHVLGKNDILWSTGLTLWGMCLQEPMGALWEHEGGHLVPRDLRSKKVMLEGITGVVERAQRGTG